MDLIKKIFFKITFGIGIYSFFHYLNRHKITILYAHSIIQSNPTHSVLWHPLRSQHNSKSLLFTLETLNKKYQFISLSTAIKILKKEIPPINNALVITLDDGYLNNITVAAPVFSGFKISPTIFIASTHTENNIPFWFDRLDYALQQIKESFFSTYLLQEKFIFDCTSRNNLKESYALFRHKIKSNFHNDKLLRAYLNELAATIENHTGMALSQIIDQDSHAKLASWQQLRKAKLQLDFEVGSHTLNHARLALLEEKEIIKELSGSKNQIKAQLQTPCNSFCYPDNSYNTSLEKFTRKYYQCALTTDPQLNEIGDNLMQLKRFNLPKDDNPHKILFKISAFRLLLKNAYLR